MTDLKGKKIFLTGATGFIGQRVLRLLISEGAQVTAPSRSPAGKRMLANLGANASDVALASENSLVNSLAGFDCVIHLAYDVRADARRNVADFRNLLHASRTSDVRAFVHMSSVVVYDDWPSGPLTEDSPVSQGGSAYRRAKIEMENIAARQALPVTILQPTLVYGPGSPYWTTRFADALLHGGIALPDNAGAAPLVYVDDVARAVISASRSPAPETRRYLISGPEGTPWPQYLVGMADILGTGGVTFVSPYTLRMKAGPMPDPNAPASGPSGAAVVSAAVRRLVGHDRFEHAVRAFRQLRGKRKGPMYPDHSLIDLYLASPAVSVKAAQGIGWSPTTDIYSGLQLLRPFLLQLAKKG